ncbi:MAG TPA: PilZ domain-containing protein [Nitrospiraceae bacterium]|nr:PilZ domain-containing protein [Nitrospiraceae bacterium]
MPFIIRTYRRFPIHCSVTYSSGHSQGTGTIWDFSVNGWKLSGDVPLRYGQTCPLTVTLPNQERIVVTAATVRWARGQEYGLETVAIDKEIHRRLEKVIKQLEEDSCESIE